MYAFDITSLMGPGSRVIKENCYLRRGAKHWEGSLFKIKHTHTHTRYTSGNKLNFETFHVPVVLERKERNV